MSIKLTVSATDINKAVGIVKDDQGSNKVLLGNGTYGELTATLSSEQEDKLNAVVLSGNGENFLANNGEYKEIGQVFDSKDYSLYDVENLQKKLDALENERTFSWQGFDKGYVSFRVDDLLGDIGEIATIFANKNAPLTVAAIPSNLTDAKKAILQTIVENGGEILSHNSGFITASSTELDVIKMCRNTKKSLEDAGFTIRGFAKSGGSGALTNWTSNFEKIAERYYDYADIGGSTPCFNMWSNGITNGLASCKSWIDTAKAQKKHLTLYFHTLAGEANVTQANIEELIDYCVAQGVGITTPAHIYDTFGKYSYGVYKKSEVDAIVTELRELIGAGGGGTVTIPNAIFNLLGSGYSAMSWVDRLSNSSVATSYVNTNDNTSPVISENGLELTTNHILKCTLDNSIQLGTNPYTVELDCVFTEEGIAAMANGAVIGFGGDNNTAWNGSVCWYPKQSKLQSGDSQILSLSPTTGTHKIIFTRDINNVITAYVDTIANKVSGTFTTTQPFNAFKIYALPITFIGMKIYNEALTETQAMSLLSTE